MAKVSSYLDTRKEYKDGLYPVVIKIRVGNSVCDISANIRLAKNQWDAGKIVNHSRQNVLNKILSSKIADINTAITKAVMLGGERISSASEIKAMIIGEKEKPGKKGTTLSEYFYRFLDRKNAEKTKETYIYTYNTLSGYADVSKLTFDEIDVSFLRDFEATMMKSGIKTNTISIHLRNIRSIYNSAIDDGLASVEMYPFRRFRIKTAQTQKRSLTVDELRILRDFPCEEHQIKYRDIFLLSFYLAGINMIDLLNLPYSESNKIEYIRSKTGIPCTIEIPEEARKLIELYKGESHLIYPMDDYKNHRDFLHRMNQNLQEIGQVSIVKTKSNGKTIFKKKYTPLFPNLTSYWARHTWATIAADIDIPDAIIDMALVHKSPYPMSDIYIRRNISKVNEAIRKVIDYLNEK